MIRTLRDAGWARKKPLYPSRMGGSTMHNYKIKEFDLFFRLGCGVAIVMGRG